MALKIGDNVEWQKINATMAKVQTAQVAINERKGEIESKLSAGATRNTSAWTSALAGGDEVLVESRDKLRKEYQSLEEKERVNLSAIEEGRLALDAITGKVSLQICNEFRPQYRKTVVPKARAAARAMLEVIATESGLVEQLLRDDVRVDHLGRISFPPFLSRESLEAFLRELGEP